MECSATLQVSDDVSTVLSVSNASEGHGVSWGETRRTLEPLVEVTVCPFDGSFGRQRSRIGEAFARCDVITGQTSEGGSHRVRLYRGNRTGERELYLVLAIHLRRGSGRHHISF